MVDHPDSVHTLIYLCVVDIETMGDIFHARSYKSHKDLFFRQLTQFDHIHFKVLDAHRLYGRFILERSFNKPALFLIRQFF